MRTAARNGAHVWGGAERGGSRILAGMRERGQEALFCNDPRVAREAEALGVPTRILPLGGDAAVPLALRFARALRRLSPDALHSRPEVRAPVDEARNRDRERFSIQRMVDGVERALRGDHP